MNYGVQFTRAHDELQKRPFLLIGLHEMKPRAGATNRHRNRREPAAAAEIENLARGPQHVGCEESLVDVVVEIALRLRSDQVDLPRPGEQQFLVAGDPLRLVHSFVRARHYA